MSAATAIPLSAKRKPVFGSPCNHCGLCCQLSLCEAALIVTPEAQAPCPHLRWRGGDALCGLVLVERKLSGPQLVQAFLGIGVGCSMVEPGTSIEDKFTYDAAHRSAYAKEFSELRD